MSLNFTLYHSKNLYELILNSNHTPDSIISSYFRQNKSLGSKDRRMISETIYSALRMYKYLSKYYNLEHHIEITLLLLKSHNELFIKNDSLNYVFLDKLSIDDLLAYSKFLENNSDIIIKQFTSIYNSDDFYSSILPDINLENCNTNLNHLARCFLYSSDLYLWLSDIDKLAFVLDEFKQMNTSLEQSKYLPYSYKLNKRANIKNSKSLKNGFVEVQELASQLASHFVAPRPNEKILDACAGGGGKTIHIASLSKDSHITANDLNEIRLNNLKERSKRLKLKNISSVVNPDLKSVSLPVENYDKLLIDAPCSGSGTFRKNPRILNNIDENRLLNYHNLQLDIINAYAKSLKVGGILIYSTCSIFKIENDDVITKLLEKNTDFIGYPFSNYLDKSLYKKLNLSIDDYKVSLYPHTHSTDGFFISTLMKV